MEMVPCSLHQIDLSWKVTGLAVAGMGVATYFLDHMLSGNCPSNETDRLALKMEENAQRILDAVKRLGDSFDRLFNKFDSVEEKIERMSLMTLPPIMDNARVTVSMTESWKGD